MRKFFTVSISILLVSCLSETSVDPGSSSTFVRYYNGGNNDEAKALELTPDGGYAILATTRIQKAESDPVQFKVKLILTDESGNPLQTKLYPDATVTSPNYQASGILALPSGGYVITGDDIQADGSIKSLLLIVDQNGEVVTETSFDYGKGRAVAITSAGNYLLLTLTNLSMHLLEIDKSTIAPITVTSYPAGQTTIASKLILDETGKAVWSGVVTNSGLTGIRVLKTVTSNVNTEFDRLISQTGFDLVGSDICRYGLDYAVVGSTNRKPNATEKSADTDILFVRLSNMGDTLSTQSFPFEQDNQNDVGNAINTTNDGGLIMLSSVSSAAIKGRGDTDFYLIRIDGFGDSVWTSSFGSKFKDEGVAVRQTPDAGYIILGTTTQGSLKILALLKTDKNGKIE